MTTNREKEWEIHITNFFNRNLPGNESNFNFTEILANFPFMIEWVIQNEPKSPLKLEKKYFWPWFDSRHGMHFIDYTGYDYDYISANPTTTVDVVLKYPNFPWNYSVLKYRFPDVDFKKEFNKEVEAISKRAFNEIITPPEEIHGLQILGKPGIDEKNSYIEDKYIPALLASGGEAEYFNKESLDELFEKNDSIFTNVCMTDKGFQEYRKLKNVNTVDIRLFSKKIWDYCSFSPLVPWEFIKKNSSLPWNWMYVIRSKRFSPEFFMTDEAQEYIYGKDISGFRNMTFELIDFLQKKNYDLDWTTISYCDFAEEKRRFFINKL